jgi:hypothetical protein
MRTEQSSYPLPPYVTPCHDHRTDRLVPSRFAACLRWSDCCRTAQSLCVHCPEAVIRFAGQKCKIHLFIANALTHARTSPSRIISISCRPTARRIAGPRTGEYKLLQKRVGKSPLLRHRDSADS